MDVAQVLDAHQSLDHNGALSQALGAGGEADRDDRRQQLRVRPTAIARAKRTDPSSEPTQHHVDDRDRAGEHDRHPDEQQREGAQGELEGGLGRR
jgi:hypothetical protein